MFTIVTGPMFAGKTTALLQALRLYPRSELLVIKPSIDDRYQRYALAAHTGEYFPAVPVERENPRLTERITDDTRIVAIDELNFFSFDSLYPDIMELISSGIFVLGGGLSFDFRRQPFGATLSLSEYADRVVQLVARCDGCGGDAIHSYRKKKIDDYLVIGGEELYGACCDSCYEQLSL